MLLLCFSVAEFLYLTLPVKNMLLQILGKQW